MAYSESANTAITPQDVLDGMPQLVWVADANGDVISINAELERYIGFGPEDERLAKEGWTHILHPDDKADALSSWRNSLRTGDSYEAEIRIKRHDGAYRWQIMRAVPHWIDDSIDSWIGTSTDVDDHRANEALLNAVAENVEDGLWVVDPDGLHPLCQPRSAEL